MKYDCIWMGQPLLKMMTYPQLLNLNISVLFLNNHRLELFWETTKNSRDTLSKVSLVITRALFGKTVTPDFTCGIDKEVQTPAPQFYPESGSHLLLWEEKIGSRWSVGGQFLQGGNMNLAGRTQRNPRTVYNSQLGGVLVVWQEVMGREVRLVAHHVTKSALPTCQPRCRGSQRCAMQDVCAERNFGEYNTTNIFVSTGQIPIVFYLTLPTKHDVRRWSSWPSPRKYVFFCRAVTSIWVSGYCTKWRIQGSFNSLSSRSLNVKTWPRNPILGLDTFSSLHAFVATYGARTRGEMLSQLSPSYTSMVTNADQRKSRQIRISAVPPGPRSSKPD